MIVVFLVLLGTLVNSSPIVGCDSDLVKYCNSSSCPCEKMLCLKTNQAHLKPTCASFVEKWNNYVQQPMSSYYTNQTTWVYAQTWFFFDCDQDIKNFCPREKLLTPDLFFGASCFQSYRYMISSTCTEELKKYSDLVNERKNYSPEALFFFEHKMWIFAGMFAILIIAASIVIGLVRRYRRTSPVTPKNSDDVVVSLENVTKIFSSDPTQGKYSKVSVN
eukprot:TRINITY_DN9636_c0_g1_i1.p1 TRINITY_DN9636_c0_g1~~TRINITY_DN9636_c0_g1_i1.p1  ORF type:complete len:219 (-),score=17.92 TRINITY_DN9636_c0_g1_i1:32-688(-)